MRRRRRFLAVAILVLWVGTVGWHIRREYFQPDLARLAEAAVAALGPDAHFYALTLEGRTIGLASSRLDTVPEGFLLEDRLTLELPALGQRGMASAVTRVTLSQALRMRTFHFTLDSDGGRFEAVGRVEGDSVLSVDVAAGGPSRTVTFRLPEPPIFAAALPLRVALSGALRVGQRMRLPVFDPSTLSTRAVEIEVLGRDTLVVPDSVVRNPADGRWEVVTTDTVPVWHLAERFGGIQLESWIDERGRIVRSSSALGFAMERTAFELAQQDREVDRALLAGGGGWPRT